MKKGHLILLANQPSCRYEIPFFAQRVFIEGTHQGGPHILRPIRSCGTSVVVRLENDHHDGGYDDEVVVVITATPDVGSKYET